MYYTNKLKGKPLQMMGYKVTGSKRCKPQDSLTARLNRILTLTDMIIPEKTAGLLVCQNDEGEEKFLVNWSGTSLCCCFYDSHD